MKHAVRAWQGVAPRLLLRTGRCMPAASPSWIKQAGAARPRSHDLTQPVADVNRPFRGPQDGPAGQPGESSSASIRL